MRTPTAFEDVDDNNTDAEKSIYFYARARPPVGTGASGAATSRSTTRAALDSRGSFIDAACR